MKYFYGVLCVLGTVLPHGALLPWLLENGLVMDALVSEAIASPVSAMAWLDVVISAAALLAFIVSESRRLKLSGGWVPALATFLVGVSLGLPLFLLLREMHMERQALGA